ncbi:MAG: hypothetical protein MHM6MM_004180 [Cercozoa sp. M6MM]
MATRGKALNTTGGARRFRFQSFSDRVAAIDVGVARLRSRRSELTKEALIKEGIASSDVTTFGLELRRILQLDKTVSFGKVAKPLLPLTHTLPLVLHHKQLIVQALLQHLQAARPSDDRARDVADTSATLHCLELTGILTKELRDEMLPYLDECAAAAMALVDPRCPELVEAALQCIGMLLKFLQRHLMTPGAIRRLYAQVFLRVLCAHQPFVRQHAAETFAYLLRSACEVMSSKDQKTVLQHLLGERPDVAHQREVVDGTASVVFEHLRGANRQLHTQFDDLFARYLRALHAAHTKEQDSAFASAVLRSAVAKLTEHGDKDSILPLVQALTTRITKLSAFASNKTGDSADAAIEQTGVLLAALAHMMKHRHHARMSAAAYSFCVEAVSVVKSQWWRQPHEHVLVAKSLCSLLDTLRKCRSHANESDSRAFEKVLPLAFVSHAPCVVPALRELVAAITGTSLHPSTAGTPLPSQQHAQVTCDTETLQLVSPALTTLLEARQVALRVRLTLVAALGAPQHECALASMPQLRQELHDVMVQHTRGQGHRDAALLLMSLRALPWLRDTSALQDTVASLFDSLCDAVKRQSCSTTEEETETMPIDNLETARKRRHLCLVGAAARALPGDRVLLKLLALLKEDATSRLSVSLLEAVQYAINSADTESIGVDTETMIALLLPALCHPHLRLRRAAISVLCAMPCLSYADEEAGDCTLLQEAASVALHADACIGAENAVTRPLTDARVALETRHVPLPIAIALAAACVGVMHLKYRPLWPLVQRVLRTLASSGRYALSVWRSVLAPNLRRQLRLASVLLERRGEAVLAESLNETGDSDDDLLRQALRAAAAQECKSTDDNTMLVQLFSLLRPLAHGSSSDGLQHRHAGAEKRRKKLHNDDAALAKLSNKMLSRDVTCHALCDLFDDFMRKEYYRVYAAQLSFDALDELSDESIGESTGDVDEDADKGADEGANEGADEGAMQDEDTNGLVSNSRTVANTTLLEFLSTLSQKEVLRQLHKMRRRSSESNKGAQDRLHALQSVALDLLSKSDERVQALAVTLLAHCADTRPDAVFKQCESWTQRDAVCAGIAAHRSALQRLVNWRTFREQMATFPLSGDNCLLESHERAIVVPVLLRLLTPKLLLRKVGRHKSTPAARRAMIFGYLSSLEAQELRPLIDFFAAPFLSEGGVSTCKTSVSAKTGFVRIVQDMAKQLREALYPFLGELLAVLRSIVADSDEVSNPALALIASLLESFLSWDETLQVAHRTLQVALVKRQLLHRLRTECVQQRNALFSFALTLARVGLFSELLVMPAASVLAETVAQTHGDNVTLETDDVVFDGEDTVLGVLLQLVQHDKLTTSVLDGIVEILHAVFSHAFGEFEEDDTKRRRLQRKRERLKQISARAATEIGSDTAPETVSRALTEYLLSHVSPLVRALAATVSHEQRMHRFARKELHLLLRCDTLLALSRQRGTQHEVFQQADAEVLVSALLPLMCVPSKSKQRRLSPDTQLLVARSLRNFVPLSSAEFQAGKRALVARWFGILRDLRVRAEVAQSLGGIFALHDGSTAEEADVVVSLLRQLTSLDKKHERVGVFADMDAKFAAYDRLQTLLLALVNESDSSIAEKTDGARLLPLCFATLFDMKDADFAVRSRASHVVSLFVKYAVHTDGEKGAVANPLVHLALAPFARRGVTLRNDDARREAVTLLAHLCRAAPDLFRGLRLLCDDDVEQDFFSNVVHIQLHRRQRALRRLGDFIEAHRPADPLDRDSNKGLDVVADSELANTVDAARNSVDEQEVLKDDMGLDKHKESKAAPQQSADSVQSKGEGDNDGEEDDNASEEEDVQEEDDEDETKEEFPLGAQSLNLLVSLVTHMLSGSGGDARISKRRATSSFKEAHEGKARGLRDEAVRALSLLTSVHSVGRFTAILNRFFHQAMAMRRQREIAGGLQGGRARSKEQAEMREQASMNSNVQQEQHVQSSREAERRLVRVVCAIASECRFDARKQSQMEDEQQHTEREYMCHQLQHKVLPRLLQLLRDPRTLSVIDSHVAGAIMSVARRLPAHVFRAELRRLVMILAQSLRTREVSIRDQSRSTLVQLCRSDCVDTSHFAMLVQQLRSALQRGHQVHVLAYTIHQVWEVLAEKVRREREQVRRFVDCSGGGDEDSEDVQEGPVFRDRSRALQACIDATLPVCIDDLLGSLALERESRLAALQEGAKGGISKEAKRSRSLDTLQLCAELCDLRLFDASVFQPVLAHFAVDTKKPQLRDDEQIERTKEREEALKALVKQYEGDKAAELDQNDGKKRNVVVARAQLRKLQQILHRFVIGLVRNDSVLFRRVHALLAQQQQQQSRSDDSVPEFVVQRPSEDDLQDDVRLVRLRTLLDYATHVARSQVTTLRTLREQKRLRQQYSGAALQQQVEAKKRSSYEVLKVEAQPARQGSLQQSEQSAKAQSFAVAFADDTLYFACDLLLTLFRREALQRKEMRENANVNWRLAQWQPLLSGALRFSRAPGVHRLVLQVAPHYCSLRFANQFVFRADDLSGDVCVQQAPAREQRRLLGERARCSDEEVQQELEQQSKKHKKARSLLLNNKEIRQREKVEREKQYGQWRHLVTDVADRCFDALSDTDEDTRRVAYKVLASLLLLTEDTNNDSSSNGNSSSNTDSDTKSLNKKQKKAKKRQQKQQQQQKDGKDQALVALAPPLLRLRVAQADVLLQFVGVHVNVHSTSDSNATRVALQLLRALLQRRVVVPRIFDIMQQVTKVLVTAHDESLQQLCGTVVGDYIMHFPLGPKRIKSTLRGLVANLDYETPLGRKAVTSCLSQLADRLPVPLLEEELAAVLFVKSAQMHSGDSEEACRLAAGDLMRAVVARVSRRTVSQLVALPRAWLQQSLESKDKTLALLATQTLGALLLSMRRQLVVFGPSQDASHALQLVQLLHETVQQETQREEQRVRDAYAAHMTHMTDDDENENKDDSWRASYHACVCVERLLCMPDVLRLVRERHEKLWRLLRAVVCDNVRHSHMWMRGVALRVLLALFTGEATSLQTALDSEDTGEVVSVLSQLPLYQTHDSARQGVLQMAQGLVAMLEGGSSDTYLLAEPVHAEVARSLVQALSLLALSLLHLDAHESKSGSMQIDEDDENEQGDEKRQGSASALFRLVKQVCSLARRLEACRTLVFQWLFVLSHRVPVSVLESLLPIVLVPLQRAQHLQVPELTEQQERAQSLAHQVTEVLQRRVSNDIYVRELHRVRSDQEKARLERRAREAQLRVQAPGKANLRRQKRHLRKRQRRREKNEEHRMDRHMRL